MTSQGSFAIIEKNQKILLVKRRDIPFWDLPGGTQEKYETAEACMRREVKEETGVIVESEFLVGTYLKDLHDDLQSVYVAKIISGELIHKGSETQEIRYFSPEKLPLNLIPLRKRQITDYFSGKKNQQIKITESKLTYKLEQQIGKLLLALNRKK